MDEILRLLVNEQYTFMKLPLPKDVIEELYNGIDTDPRFWDDYACNHWSKESIQKVRKILEIHFSPLGQALL